RDQAELFTGTRLQGPATLRLLDASGRLVRQQQVVITGRRTTFSTADLAPGSYLVELAAGTEQVRLWMVKD
ncbi:MAG: T9SS type A sorting domain-containing protein, partial [Flavobacteriales bacterium]|nr:T9SS type A sorting domain-containing protein [Flavobacteriales bacterium]